MPSEAIWDDLIEWDVLEPAESDEALALTTEFQNLVNETKSELDGNLEQRLRDQFDDPDTVDALTAVGSDDTLFVAYYCALAERSQSLSHETLVRIVTVLAQIRDQLPRSEGAPDSFLPVHGDQLSTLLKLTPRAIVYVWREDCDPCDLMRESLDDTLGDSSEDISLFAVYGPNWAETLYHQFDVSGAPTTLFVLDGSVDSRLHGAAYEEAIEGEIGTLLELSETR